VPVEGEVPVGVGGEPVAVAAVHHDLGAVADPEPVHQGGEGLGADEVAAERVLEVVLPVDGQGAGDVAAGVGVGVLVHLQDAPVRERGGEGVEVGRELGCAQQGRAGRGGHVMPSSGVR
jgi:hypothetical protein